MITINTYEDLLLEASDLNLQVKEFDLKGSDGRIDGKRIAINRNLTSKEKNCVLAEELGHYHTSVGNILYQQNMNEEKQEIIARRWAYEKHVNPKALIQAFEKKCLNRSDLAERLNITEQFLEEALAHLKSKYGLYIEYENYIIYLDPFAILEIYT